jgi:ferrochelatase
MNKDKCEFGCRGSQDKIGVLVAQLGTPDSPTPAGLRPYLREFLWDKRVIEVPRILWWFLLNFVILVTRPKRSARLYKRIWMKEGSPLLVITRRQTEALRSSLQSNYPHIEVEFGMRYGSNSLESAVDTLLEKGCSKILLFPMYPQYSATTTASIYDAVFPHLLKRRWVPTLKVAEPYYVHPKYISALATVVNEHLAKMEWAPEKLVLSYHGIPEKYVAKGDVYCCQCVETTAALLPKLSLPAEKVIHTFQSRFGRDPWLRPYTDVTFEELGHSGMKQVATFAPGFTADCLETLDELGNEGIEQFQEAGGEKLSLISCLNDHPAWVSAMADIVKEELGSWLTGEARTVSNCDIFCPVKIAAQKEKAEKEGRSAAK